MSAGQRILDGLKDAIAGNFAAVMINGQRWVRSDVQTELVQALLEIAARARFELDSPTEMRDTAFSLIEKTANAALEKAEFLNLEEPRG